MVVVWCAALLVACAPTARASPAPRVVVMAVDGAIQPASLRYLERGVETASREAASLILLELDTPGGLLVSLRKMTGVITQSKTPVAAYVTPPGGRAASAGFFVLLAADVAAMAPGTNTGAAHPVAIGGPRELPKTMLEKVTNDSAALIRSLAAQRGRSVTWAEKAVRESRSYTDREALARGLIDLVATDRARLLAALDGKLVRRFDGREQKLALGGARVEHLRPNAGERLLAVIAIPEVAYLLLVLGGLGLFVELFHPGGVVPGVVGALSLLLALYGLSVLPVNVVGVLLLVVAMGLFVAEAFIVSHGLLGLAGLVCFVFGSVMLVDTPVPGAGISFWLVLPVALLVGGVMTFLMTRVIRARRAPALSGLQAMVGEEGEVVVPLAPEGKVFVHGEYWDAVGAAPLPRGAQVRVTAVSERSLRVEQAPAHR